MCVGFVFLCRVGGKVKAFVLFCSVLFCSGIGIARICWELDPVRALLLLPFLIGEGGEGVGGLGDSGGNGKWGKGRMENGKWEWEKGVGGIGDWGRKWTREVRGFAGWGAGGERRGEREGERGEERREMSWIGREAGGMG